MSRLMNVLSCASAAALMWGLGAPAYAQSTDPITTPSAEESTDDADAADESEAIYVTGSRISRRDYMAVSPIVTMNAQTLEQSSAITLESALNTLPQMGVGTGSSTIQNRTGRSSANLRGLGEPRSLVLLNGRRIQPGEPGGAVDLTILPGNLIRSVETITGGASAAYGSDAMAGVVNIILRDDFTGLMATAQMNYPQDGNGVSEEYSIAAGGDFAEGRGNGFLVFSYADRDELMRRDRDFFQISTVNGRFGRLIINNAANPPSQSAIDAVFGSYGADPGDVNRTTTISFNDDGTLFTPAPGAGRDIINYRGTFDERTILLNNAIQSNQGWTYSLINPLTRYNLFGHVDYDITSNISWFGEGLFTNYENTSTTASVQVGTTGSSISIPVTNPFIPADFQTLLASRTNPNADFSGVIGFEALPLGGYTTQQNVFQLTTGLEGDLDIRDWTWSAYITHGNTHITSRGSQVNLRLIEELIDAPDGGASICAGGLNIFAPDDQMSPDCLQYIYYRAVNQLDITQTASEAILNGSLLELPAGDLSFAAGAAFRRERYYDVIDREASDGNLPGDLSGPSTGGERTVTEFFGELLVPILSDLPLVDRLEANLGFRSSEYSNAGRVESYSSNLTWDVTDTLTLRGGYSRAIRAPSLLDLYASGVFTSLRLGTPSATTTGGDPCDTRSSFRLGPNGPDLRALCLALGVPAPAIDTYQTNAQTIFGQTRGNPNLENEYADTYTFGVILQSPFSNPWLEGLRVSFDYFDIEINDAIGQIPLTSALARCYNLDGVSNPTYDPNEPACDFFPRDNTGQITRLDVPLLNLARYQTTGIDVQLDWRLDLESAGFGSIGEFSVNILGTYLDSFEVQQLATTPSLDYAGYSQSPIDPNGRPSVLPHWRSTMTFMHSIGPLQSAIRWRYVGPVDDVSLVTNPTSTTAGADAYNQFDASLNWEVNEGVDLRFGINNFTDAQPYVLSGVRGNTDQQSYDVVGRTYYLAVRKTF